MSFKVEVLAVASKLHRKEYLDMLIKRLENSLKELGLKINNIITEPDDVKKIEIQETPMIFVMTGGTSKVIRKIDERVDEHPLVLVSHPYHNSLPSALSARARLEAKGSSVILHFHVADFNKNTLENIVKIVDLYEYVRNLRVILIGDIERDEINKFEKVSGKVKVIDIDSIKDRLNNVEISENDINTVEKGIDTSGSNLSLIKGPLSLYKVTKEMLKSENANALAIDCFPFIIKYKFTPCLTLSLLLSEGIPAACEADLRSLLLLGIAQRLTGNPGWIFNPSDYNDHKLVGAHCTIALKLVDYATLIPHFETGRPYAISGTLSNGIYTLAAVSPDYRTLAVAKAKVIVSGTISGGRCRTQVVMELDEKDPIPFTEKAISNHHVLIKGDVINYLKNVAKMLRMKFFRY